MNPKKNDAMQIKQTFIFSFFIYLIILFFLLVWLPQYTHHAFEPAVITWPLKETGMDLYTNYCSAKQVLLGHSGRFFNPNVTGPIYPYPIGGTISNYGALTVVLMMPFTHLHFKLIYALWSLISFSIVFFFINKIYNMCCLTVAGGKKITLIAGMLLLICSGPMNLLLERGQLEIIIPFLLFFVWQDFIQEKLSTKTALILGLAIHIKVWPLALLAIFMKKKYWHLFTIGALLPLFLDSIFYRWLPITELIKSTMAYNHAAIAMTGWSSISLYSLIAALGIKIVSWKMISFPFYIIMGLLTLYFLKAKVIDESAYKNLLFVFIVIYSLLTPAFMCDYTLASFLLLLLCFSNALPSKFIAFLCAIEMSSLLLFQIYAGPIKAIGLLILLLLTAEKMLSLKRQSVPR